MKADVTTRDYYYKFINDANKDREIYLLDLKELNEIIDDANKTINDGISILKSKYNIDCTKHKEFMSNEYDESKTLYNKLLRLIHSISIDTERVGIYNIIKLCNLLKKRKNLEKLIELCDKRNTLKYAEFNKIVNLYYREVQKSILKGNGYKFKKRIGVFFAARWAIPENAKAMVDMRATNKRKAEIIASGCTPYNEEDAKWHKENNIPYDGIPYIIHRKDTHFYQFGFVGSRNSMSKNLDFEHTQYVHNMYKGIGYKDMADKCKTLDEIVDFPVDIKYKLNMFLHKFPEQYVNFIRSYDENRSSHRKNYFKTRQ